MIYRRDVLILLGGAAVAWPLAARAQSGSKPVIGLLASAAPDQWTARLRAFRQGLAEIGYVEGKNVGIEYRWAHGQYDRLPALAADLVRQQVAVIVVLGNTLSTLAAKAATATIPIVFRVAVNPVAMGLAASLNRPGGNLTGVTTLGLEVGPKQLDLMHECVPGAKVVALLVNPTNAVLADTQSRDLPAAAHALGLQPHVLKASSDHDFDAVFATLVQLRAGMLMIGVDAFFNSRNDRLAALALRHRMPTISPYREFAEAGGLMSYGGSIVAASRQAGAYTGRILKGEKPANLPVQMATKVELIVNLKTAKALGIAIPEAIMFRADETIE